MADYYLVRDDLDALEASIVQYIWQWGQHLDGVHEDTIAGTPVAAANMAMSVIRKHLVPVPPLYIGGDCERCDGWHDDGACPVHVPWFARFRARIFGDSRQPDSGSYRPVGEQQ